MRPRNTPLTTLYLPTPTFTGELALDPAVVWIEPLFPMRAANRYAKGTCQSGSYASQPLEAASINITGMGQVTILVLPPPPPPLSSPCIITSPILTPESRLSLLAAHAGGWGERHGSGRPKLFLSRLGGSHSRYHPYNLQPPEAS